MALATVMPLLPVAGLIAIDVDAVTAAPVLSSTNTLADVGGMVVRAKVAIVKTVSSDVVNDCESPPITIEVIPAVASDSVIDTLSVAGSVIELTVGPVGANGVSVSRDGLL